MERQQLHQQLGPKMIQLRGLVQVDFVQRDARSLLHIPHTCLSSHGSVSYAWDGLGALSAMETLRVHQIVGSQTH